jgi:hypothetical protein
MVGPPSGDAMTTPDSPRISFVSIRRPSVMLVRVDPGTEPEELRLEDVPAQVLRVRHPLPACVRMRVTRPCVVLVGRSVLPRDFMLILAEAERIGAATALLGGMSPREDMHEWLVNTIAEVQTKRASRALWRAAS